MNQWTQGYNLTKKPEVENLLRLSLNNLKYCTEFIAKTAAGAIN
jgi:hypothetical protein